ncbi:MAG: UDP-N-acetylmuramoyl-L-alanyl-D-glutamate--2,6-diaminopimelate ligase [Alphaproteobacteria bacterium]|jgi:UDP-N-acetylmuramoyl-L-alanyl-D-glutamate--2,6-diaminopimelate ligase|nr:UDP-N-acetylmuramoyl-L-alanyl-D-glutamate--2,6-diaminopimelate ligase [Alphaproteobacteria bacterium]
MQIKDILEKYPNITNITDDSRQVSQGSIFVAIAGEKFNGVDFIDAALAKGAIAVVVSEDYKNKLSGDKLIFVENPRDFLSCSIFYLNREYIPQNILTVSGTNGKTSTSLFVSQFLNHLKIKNMVIGTLGIYIDGKLVSDSLTNPSASTLIKYFKITAEAGIEYVVMESSSHGLAQHRTDGLQFKVAGFTNLTQDHLDYHKTMEEYFTAKKRLYTDLASAAVINVDDVYGERLAHSVGSGISYGFKADGLKILEINNLHTSQTLKILYENKEYEFSINLIGEFQVYNILCAMGMLLSVGFNIADLIEIAPKILPATGRLELVSQQKINAKIFVDYAHTPDALEQVLKTLKKEEHNRLLVIFGCGGDRDKTKRPKMGKIASELADVVYITDDNPRTENAEVIRAEVAAGIINRAGLQVYNIGGRREAIVQALDKLQDGDILLVAGKGHEDYQIIGETKHHFSDRETILEVLNATK